MTVRNAGTVVRVFIISNGLVKVSECNINLLSFFCFFLLGKIDKSIRPLGIEVEI